MANVAAGSPAFGIGFHALLNLKDAQSGFGPPAALLRVISKGSIRALVVEHRPQKIGVQ